MAGDTEGVHLDLGGQVVGHSLQAGTINGSVYLGHPPPPPPDDGVLIAVADGEQSVARQLIGPLRARGHKVSETMLTLDQTGVATAVRALESGALLVVCATVRAIGTRWTREIIDGGDRDRIFVVQLEADADVTHFAERVLVAEAVEHLVDAVTAQFPPDGVVQPGDDDERPLLERPTDCGTFDFHAVERFRNDLRDDVADGYPNTLSPWDFLERAGLWADGRLTGTGALLFSTRRPARLAASVICTRYEGTDKSSVRDTKTFEDCLPDQIRKARRFVADLVRVGELPDADQAQSKAVYAYPMVAVREIIANALVHRDYGDTTACVHVRLFSDRLEVSSPGEWLGRTFPDGGERSFAELQGQSKKRNLQLARVLAWIKLVEGEGSGIPTAVQDCADQNCPPPTVTQEQGFVVVTLYPKPEPAIARHEHIRPAALPRGTPLFIGRETELTSLSAEGPVLFVVHGMGGVGKTELVTFWARQVKDRFPDGQLYVNLSGYGPGEPTPPAEVLTGFLSVLGVSPQAIPATVEAQAALFRSMLARQRLLVVLDNASHVDQVRPLLPGDGDSVVVVTSRHRMQGLVGAHSIEVGPLSAVESHQLFTGLLGDSRVSAERDAAGRLVVRSASLPLALRIIASLASTTESLAALDDELRERRNRLDVLDLGDDATSIERIFSWSYRSLEPGAALAFRTLALHPGPHADMPAIAAMLDLPETIARSLVRELARAHMLQEPAPGRYWFHDLLRDYAERKAREDGTPDGAERRMLAHYLTRTDEPATVLNMINHAAANAFSELTWRLAWKIAPVLDKRGLWRDWITSHQTALTSAERAGDAEVQARTHDGLGTAYSRYGQYTEALQHHGQALELSKRNAHHGGEARAHLAISEINERKGRYTEALTHAQQAWELYRMTGNTSGEARALNLLGWWHTRLDRHDQARTYCEQALELFQAASDREGEAAALHRLGYIHHHLGDYAGAAMSYLRALDLWHVLGDRHNEAITRAHLGNTQHAIGDHTTAIDLWAKALDVLSEFDDPDAETLRAKLHLGRTAVM
ncbi:tetratricopeptide repeat protein [Lentzea sp. NBRC 105346]|uniref:tetratricopeptide repeat protein n=1 Tax=Lentzea sp. NBRC 105346 TaxID=3032205 RepID=UPI002554F661|nr:tetratricopeptide repeat protein [Lentzea sp. NBRC 105346]